MKKTVGNKVFLQKFDVAFIMRELHTIPIYFLEATFDTGGYFIMSGGPDSFEFDSEFSGDAAKWITEQDWLIDFDEYRKMSKNEILELQRAEQARLGQDIDIFYTHDDHYQSEHYDEENDRFLKQRHKLQSMGVMIQFLDKEVKFAVPGAKRKHRFF